MGIRIRQISAVVLLLAAVACSKHAKPGSTIYFSAVSRGTGAVSTKTSYSGTDQNGNPVGPTSTLERLDWVASDAIRIYCREAHKVGDNDIHWGDYVVKDVKNESNVESRATISPEEPNSLTWGSGSHTFYAMYPAPADNTFKEDHTLVGTIPAAQTVTQKPATNTWLPDMSYAYMMAKTVANDGPVSLDFSTRFTAFSFTIGPGENTKVDVTSFILSSSSTALAGNFTVNEDVYNFSSTSNAVTITWDPAIEVTSDVTFTVFCLPQDLTNLTVTFTGDQIGTRSLKLNDAVGTPLVFKKNKKYRIYGMRFPKLTEVSFGEDILWDLSVLIEQDPILWAMSVGFNDDVDWDHSVPSTIPTTEKINWEE